MLSSFGKILPVLEKARKYLAIVVIVIVAGVYGFIILTASKLASDEPSHADIANAHKSVKKVEVDDVTLFKIQNLQDQNVQFQALIEDARNNPFNE